MTIQDPIPQQRTLGKNIVNNMECLVTLHIGRDNENSITSNKLILARNFENQHLTSSE
jgi:hypothetical protein